MLRTTLMSLALCMATHSGAAAAAAVHPSSPCNISVPGIGLSEGSQIFFPTSDGWDDETIRWTEYNAPTYSVAVRPALESDVQALVR